MQSNSWSIAVLNGDGSQNGAAQTLAQLGIEDAEYDLNNMSADVLTLRVGGLDFDAATLWPYGTLLALLKPNGVRAFVGRVEPWSREGKPDNQSHIGRLVNPWWYLANLMYQQRYSITNFVSVPVVGQPNPPSNTVTVNTNRVVLNILFGAQGFYSCTTGAQIADALSWAISQGAPIAIGEMDPSTQPFSDFNKGILCSEVVEKMFRKEPDFVVDWDYTTLPFPTMHCRKMKSLVPLVIDLTNDAIREEVMIKERPDWQRSYVRIFYDQKFQTSAGGYLYIFADWYSARGQGNSENGVAVPGSAPMPVYAGDAYFHGVDLFADLTGSNTAQTTQTASFASIPYDITDIQTWKRWDPSLMDNQIESITILGPQTIPASDLIYYGEPSIAPLEEYAADGSPVLWDPTCVFEVVDGEWADWIPNVNGQRQRVTANAFIVTKKGERHYRPLHYDLTSVSLNTGGISTAFTSSNNTTKQYAEPVPVGLAKAMYQSWQNLAIEGSFSNVEAVIGASQQITRSNVLNFTTGPGVNWSAVNAIVQRISGNIAKGTTKVQFGAPLHLTGNELIDAVRATRYRLTTVDLSYLFGGPFGGGGSNVTMGRKTHARHGTHGIPHKQVDAVSGNVAPVAGVDPVITHDGTTGITSWIAPGGPTQTPPGGQLQSLPTVSINPANAKGSDGNWHPLTIQEQKVCVNINGVLKQRTLLALTSQYYQAPDDPI
ncbi:MAG: hypothetical protein KGJ13_03610 [Patescibacteria group bacterium]|nr:hypothetical protein [Patescibacteria group bacterium]